MNGWKLSLPEKYKGKTSHQARDMSGSETLRHDITLDVLKRTFATATAAVALTIALGAFSSAYAGAPSSAQAAAAYGKFLIAQRSINAPAGFSGLCAKYGWVCLNPSKSALGDEMIIRISKAVNRQVNRNTRSLSDQDQYGREEYWALPSARGGDCEDFVLLKKKMLIERGVPPQNLLIATVLDRQHNSHAVLVLRTAGGDIVLDNLTWKILRWEDTGYTFLKLQNPTDPQKWDAVLAGGLIKRPVALLN